MEPSNFTPRGRQAVWRLLSVCVVPENEDEQNCNQYMVNIAHICESIGLCLKVINVCTFLLIVSRQ